MAKKMQQAVTHRDIIEAVRNRDFAPVYLLMGDESYYIDRVSEYIADNVLTEDEKGFNQQIIYCTRETNVADIINSAKRYPMMAEYQVVIVKEAQNLLKLEELSYYVLNPLKSTILVICYKNGSIDKRKKIVAAIEKEGVVFEVWDDGNSGKIVSMTQSASALQWSSDEAEQKRFVGADNQTYGAANMAVIKSISGWEDKYPAFKWCADLGEGWYLPAKEELLTIYSNKAAIDANLTGQLLSSWYWSSTEYDYYDSDGVFCAWGVDMGDGDSSSYYKYGNFYVRAVSAFGNAKPTPTTTKGKTSAPYKVGEIVAVAQSYSQIENEIERLGLPLNLKEEIRKHKGYNNKMYVRAGVINNNPTDDYGFAINNSTYYLYVEYERPEFTDNFDGTFNYTVNSSK